MKTTEEKYCAKRINCACGSTIAVVLFFCLAIILAGDELNIFSTRAFISETLTSEQDPFVGLPLQAKAVFVLDCLNKTELYGRNADEVLPLASLAKVVTVLTALKNAPEGMIVAINSKALLEEGDSGLFLDEKWRLSEISKLTLVSSSNDGARAIAEAVGSVFKEQEDSAYDLPEKSASDYFIEAMNNEVSKNALVKTFFLNPTGLDEATGTPGGFSSARDIAIIFGEAVRDYRPIFEATRVSTLSVVSKSGCADTAGGNLVVVFGIGFAHPIVIVILGSSAEERFSDALLLTEATLK